MPSEPKLKRSPNSPPPPLLAYKQEKQDEFGIVTGGFLCFLIWKPLNGLRLGIDSMEEPYWSLSPSERADIRDAFKVAYEYVNR